MMHHTLKILPCYYAAKIAGEKLFEIRSNDDRGFQKGDTVSYIDAEKPYLNQELEGLFEITYVTNYEQQPGFVVFGERRVD